MLFILILLIILAFTINAYSQNHTIDKVVYNRNLLKRVVEPNEIFEVTSIIENRGKVPITFLQITETYPSEFEFANKVNFVKNTLELVHKATMMIMGHQRVKRTNKMFVLKRGKYLVNDVIITAGDILGLSVVDKEIGDPHEIIVKPIPYELENNFVVLGDYNGNISVRRWIIEDPVLTIGIREYTGLEPMKTIHWPSSLRYNKLMVKKFDYTTDNKALVILNVETYKPFWFNVQYLKIEKAISISRTIIEDFEENGIPYSLYANSQSFSGYNNAMYSGLGSTHLNQTLELLGAMDYSVSTPFEDALQSIISQNTSFSTIVIVTPVLLEEYVYNINLLAEKCEKLILFTLDNNNLAYLSSNIITYVERGEVDA